MSDIEKAENLEVLKAQGQPNGDLETIEATTAPLEHAPEAKRSDLEAHARLVDRLVLLPNFTDPKAYNRKLKWAITILVSAAAVIDSITTNIFYPALPELPGSLSTSPTVANLAVALPIISSAILPLYWSYASEKYGRRVVYILSLIPCVVFGALSAVSSSIAMLIVMRILSAGAGCAVTPIGAAVVGDIWEVKEKGQAMSVYYVGLLLGPSLGPVIGGALVQRWSWRATQWFQIAYGALILIFISFSLPDTTQKAIIPDSTLRELPPRQQEDSSRSPVTILRQIRSATLRPLRIVRFLRSPAITLTVYLSSITFLVVKALQISIQQSYAGPPFNFDALIIGLTFIPFAIGLIVGDLVGGKWSDHVMHRTAVASNRYDSTGGIILVPEDRMKENAWLAILCLPAGLVWYGWGVQYGEHWIVPIIGEVFVGLSVGLIFSLVTTVLVELLPQQSASLVALNSLGENLFATVGTAMAQPLQSAIGAGWLYTMFAFVTLASLLVVLLMRRYGRQWRAAANMIIR